MTSAPPAAAPDSTAPVRRNALVEAAVEALRAAGRPMTIQRLARDVLHVEASGAHVAVRVLTPLLEGDERLAAADAGHWGLAAWTQDAERLDEVEFVVFDIETNGGRSGRHRVLEVGALRVRAGQVLETFASLVRLPSRVSKFVTRYTGITDEMLTDAPAITDVLDDFRRFQSGSVLVAHNLPTDLGYLNRECVWLGRALFPGNGVDTMELSAALMPDLPGGGLATVLAAADIQDAPTHRALDDAGVTAELFRYLLERAAAGGARTLADLRRLAAAGGPEGKLPRRARELARWSSRNLPPSPGVYVFRDPGGQALYVGKSVSLQRRVRSHFTDSAGPVRRRDGMLDRIEAIEWESTGSELRALVREAELITSAGPEYNVQRRWRFGRRFVRIGPPTSAAVHTAAHPRDDGAAYLGPFRTARDARLASTSLRRIFALPSLRSADKTAAAWRCDAAVLFLGQGKDAALHAVETCSAPEDERAEVQRRIRRARVLRHPAPGGLGAAPALVLAPGAAPGEVELARVDAGLITAVESITRPRPRSVCQVLARLRGAQPRSAGEDSNERRVVLAWLHTHAESPEVVPWPRGAPREFAAQVYKCARRLAATG